MTIRQAINQLRLDIRRQKLYDDDQLDDRLLKAWVIDQRALWLRNEMNKPRSVDEQIIQTIGCLPLEVADKSSCPAYLTDYHILQTTTDIPKTIELNNGDGIIEVGYVDRMAYPTSYVTLQRLRFAGNGKFNSNIIHTARYGQRFLVKSTGPMSHANYLRYLRIRGVFEDPEALANFTHVSGDPCYSDDDDFPMNRWMWNYIKEAIKQANFKELVTAPTDEINDASENLTAAIDGTT